MGGDGVRQPAGVVDAGNRGENFGGNLLVEFDVLIELLHHGATQGLDFTGLATGRADRFGDRFDRRHVGREERLPLLYPVDERPLLPLDQHLDGAVRQLEHLQDGGDAADIKHVRHQGVVLGRRLLRHQHDAPLGLHRRLQRLDAFWAADKQRYDHMRKHHDIAQRQQWQIQWGGGKKRGTGHGRPLSYH